MSEYFPKLKYLGEYMSNYETKLDLKYSTGDDTSDFAKNIDLANLKSSKIK